MASLTAEFFARRKLPVDDWPKVPRAKKKTCPVCLEEYWNAGAHAERCYGRPVQEKRP